MSEPERQWSASPYQLATIILAIVAIYLLASVVSRAINIVDLKRQQATLQASYTELEGTISTLRAQAQYLQSDSYYSQMAHGELYWALPGEKLIIPMGRSPQPTPTVVPARQP